MVELKSLQPESVSAALKKAKHYRLLGEPDEAESICLDILAAVPDQPEAKIVLLLALTDKFAHSGLNPSFQQANEIAISLDPNYCKSYYFGIIYERRAKFHLRRGGPGAGTVAHEWFVKAMEAYNKAMNECEPETQNAVLRWNSCARVINETPEVKADDGDNSEMMLDSFDTPH